MSGLSSPGNRAWSQVQTPFYTRLCLGSFVMVAAGNYCMGQGDCSVSWPVVPVLEAQLVSFLMRFSPPKPPSCRLIVAPSPCTELGPHLPFRGLQIYHSYCSLHISYRVPQISVLSIHLQSCIPRTTGVSQMAVLPNCF